VGEGVYVHQPASRFGRIPAYASLPSALRLVPHPALVFVIAFGATLVASMSGGSASIITTPAWLFLGVPLPVADGCAPCLADHPR
jgi:hypothetical protein